MKLTKITDEEETSPTQSNTDANITIWTTESLENATLRYESSSEEELETSDVSSNPPEEITNDTDSPIGSTESPTESTTYQYNNDATESQFDEDSPDAESTRKEDTMNLEGDGAIPAGTTATFEPQQDVLPPEQISGSHPPANNNSLTPANHKNHILLDKSTTDETESDSTPADEETTISDFVDEIRGNETRKY